MPTKAERDNEAVRLDMERRLAAKKGRCECGHAESDHRRPTSAMTFSCWRCPRCPGYKEATKQ